jgi:AcrR family transcriptional regulator
VAEARGTIPTGRRIRGLDADERRAQRRQQVLDAALELIASRGYANTSIEQICQTAYVATRSFYELFDSKEACYLALLEQLTREISEKVVAALDDAPDDGDAATDALLSAFAHALVDDPRVGRASFGEAVGVSTAVERQRRANRRWGAAFLEDVWRRYGVIGRGSKIGDADVHRVAVGVIGGLFDLVTDWLHDADTTEDTDAGKTDAAPDVDTLVRDLTDFYRVVRDGMTSRRA